MVRFVFFNCFSVGNTYWSIFRWNEIISEVFFKLFQPKRGGRDRSIPWKWSPWMVSEVVALKHFMCYQFDSWLTDWWGLGCFVLVLVLMQKWITSFSRLTQICTSVYEKKVNIKLVYTEMRLYREISLCCVE